MPSVSCYKTKTCHVIAPKLMALNPIFEALGTHFGPRIRRILVELAVEFRRILVEFLVEFASSSDPDSQRFGGRKHPERQPKSHNNHGQHRGSPGFSWPHIPGRARSITNSSLGAGSRGGAHGVHAQTAHDPQRDGPAPNILATHDRLTGETVAYPRGRLTERSIFGIYSV